MEILASHISVWTKAYFPSGPAAHTDAVLKSSDETAHRPVNILMELLRLLDLAYIPQLNSGTAWTIAGGGIAGKPQAGGAVLAAFPSSDSVSPLAAP
jgi:hypothetical protein